MERWHMRYGMKPLDFGVILDPVMLGVVLG